MATKELVTKVWIEPGCIVCDACETACPEVFEVLHDDETCVIRPEALDIEFTKPLSDQIGEAAEECPVDVIKFETESVEVPDEAVAAGAEPVAVGADRAEETVATPEEQVAKKDSALDAAAKAPSTKAAPAKPRELPIAKEPDPAIQALLEATTVRGGRAIMERDAEALSDTLHRLAKLSPDELPPDGRFHRTLAGSRQKKSESSRREWLIGGAWATFAAGFFALPTAATLRFMMPNVLEQEEPKVRCGPLSKYAAMQSGDVNEDFKPVKPFGFWIIREEDRISALSIICTHLGCIPSWLPNDRKFKCPCHGSGFKPDGVNFEGPAPRPLERFKIYTEGDEVIVDRSKKFLAMGPADTAVWNDPDAYVAV